MLISMDNNHKVIKNIIQFDLPIFLLWVVFKSNVGKKTPEKTEYSWSGWTLGIFLLLLPLCLPISPAREVPYLCPGSGAVRGHGIDGAVRAVPGAPFYPGFYPQDPFY